MRNLKLSEAQNVALKKLKESPLSGKTANELNVRISTLQSLKSLGLVNNLQRFGSDEVIGNESKTIKWVVSTQVNQ